MTVRKFGTKPGLGLVVVTLFGLLTAGIFVMRSTGRWPKRQGPEANIALRSSAARASASVLVPPDMMAPLPTPSPLSPTTDADQSQGDAGPPASGDTLRSDVVELLRSADTCFRGAKTQKTGSGEGYDIDYWGHGPEKEMGEGYELYETTLKLAKCGNPTIRAFFSGQGYFACELAPDSPSESAHETVDRRMNEIVKALPKEWSVNRYYNVYLPYLPRVEAEEPGRRLTMRGSVSNNGYARLEVRCSQALSDPGGSYKLYLRAGQKKEAVGLWPEAILDFEAALKLRPEDAQTLSELGWVIFETGNLDRAKTVNARALAASVSPKLKAEILYNMGRVAEAEQDNKTAADFYTRSIAAWPSQVVSGRLGALGKPAPAPTSNVEPLPCAEPRPLAEVCQCLQQVSALNALIGESGPWVSGKTTPMICTESDELKTARSRVIKVEIKEMRLGQWFLLTDTGKGWAVSARLSVEVDSGRHKYHGFVWDLSERPLGSARILRVVYEQTEVDDDNGRFNYDKNTYDREPDLFAIARSYVLLCVFPKGPGAPHCPVKTPLTERLSQGGGEGTGPLTRDERSKYKVELSADGTATIILTEGHAREGAQLGRVRLW